MIVPYCIRVSVGLPELILLRVSHVTEVMKPCTILLLPTTTIIIIITIVIHHTSYIFITELT